MGDANEEFKSMGSVISQSKKLITKYGRREVTDRVLILFAAAFFFAVVFIILRKRVFGPLDPFPLIWSSVTTTIGTVINLLTSDNNNQDNVGTRNLQDNLGHPGAAGHAEL
jgi:hypothetical protein